MDTATKNAYLSPANGMLDISVIRDSRPYVLITLDLGIPNFTVFSLKFPLVEDKPNSMSELVAEAVHTLLDEMSAFMISTGYKQEVIVVVYASVLACFKGMTGEADTNKSMSEISKDPTVKSFEGTFKLPMSFINETYDRVVTAAGKTIKRPPPAHRHLELTHDKPMKTNVNDARRVILNYRNRSLKTQPGPLYMIVYDLNGNARGTIPLGGNFKNQLLNQMYKKGAHTPEFTPTVKFDSDIDLRSTNVEGIPKSIFIADKVYTPFAFVGDDMALYRGEQDWLVNLPDGRCVAFAERPSIEKLKAQNYPVPTVYERWTLLPKEAVPESSDESEAVDEQGNEVIEPMESDTPVVSELVPDDVKAKHSSMKKRGDHKDENGNWVGEGGAASGVLPICTSTGRIALAWRSKDVHKGDCWGTIGGAVQKGMNPSESAKEEMVEETGYQGGITLIPSFVYQDEKFKYHNFIGLVPKEFHLNPIEGGSDKLKFEDENDALAWFSWDDLMKQTQEVPSDFHPGVLSLLEHSGDQIKEICGVASNRLEENEDVYSS